MSATTTRPHPGRRAVPARDRAAAGSDLVLELWCRLTGNDPAEFGADEREAFDARPQVPLLAAVAYPRLLDAGVETARRGSLPLERWLGAVRQSG